MRVLTVCLGNRWRSPYAALLIKHLCPAWEVRSRGLSRTEGVKMERPARARILARWPGIPREEVEAHRSKQLTGADLTWADIVLVMSPRHEGRVVEEFGQPTRIEQLARFADLPEVRDPHQRSPEEQLLILAQLDRACQSFVEWFR